MQNSPNESFSLNPIGYVKTDFDHKFGTPRQGSLAPHSSARFELVKRWQDKGIFEGLEGFSHVWLISYFHQSQNARTPSKIHPPRLEGRSVGVLASRSPHRPNNVGLTLARVRRLEGETLFLSEVDLVDGTPILDIKPYLPEADRPTEFHGGWTDLLKPTAVACSFSAEADVQIQMLHEADQIEDVVRFKNLAREVLSLDPRPLSYRARVNERFAVVLAGMDVHAVHENDQFTVVSVQVFVPQR